MIEKVKLYTDGSANSQNNTGVWGAIIITNSDEKTIYKTEQNCTHNQMELLAIIKGIEYALNSYSFDIIEVYTDSQYAVNLLSRKEKLQKNHFYTKKGDPVKNVDLVKKLLLLLEQYPVKIIKVKAHLKKGEGENDYNRKVDKLVRKKLREVILKSQEKTKIN